MVSKPLVIVTRKLPELIETRMMELFNTKLNTNDEPLDTYALKKAISDNRIIIIHYIFWINHIFF